MLAKDAAGSILPPALIGAAVFGGGLATHIAIGETMSARGGLILLALVAAPGALLLLYSLFLVWFFRDPERELAPGLVSPADGKVVLVETIDDPDVGHGHRIAVFMSPIDVHVNRAPAAATLQKLEHKSGGYVPAFRKESERNERVITVWRTEADAAQHVPEGATVKLVQIAGTLARRIVPWVEPGAALGRGDRFGMIKLGSRVDVYLPASFTPAVSVGDRVKAGASTLAHAARDA